MRSALGARDGVDLVEDDGFDPVQRLACLRRQEQVERLRSRDEDVGRALEHPPALVGRRVAGAHADRELGVQSGKRAPQVPLDVVVERLERGDVEQAQASTGRLVQPIDAGKEGGEGLAGSGRGLDEDVPAARDRRPAELLRARRLGKCTLEPAPSSVVTRPRARPPGERTAGVVSSGGARRRPRRRGWNRRLRARSPPQRSLGSTGVPRRGRAGLRTTRRGPLAAGDPRPARAPGDARLGYGRRGRPAAGRADPRRLIGRERMHGARRLPGRLRRMGRGLVVRGPSSAPRARDGDAPHRASGTRSTRRRSRRRSSRPPRPPGSRSSPIRATRPARWGSLRRRATSSTACAGTPPSPTWSRREGARTSRSSPTRSSTALSRRVEGDRRRDRGRPAHRGGIGDPRGGRVLLPRDPPSQRNRAGGRAARARHPRRSGRSRSASACSTTAGRTSPGSSPRRARSGRPRMRGERPLRGARGRQGREHILHPGQLGPPAPALDLPRREGADTRRARSSST